MLKVSIKMKTPKVCSDSVCGKVHTIVPERHRLGSDGVYYWECDCHSTFAYAPSYTAAGKTLQAKRDAREALAKAFGVPA